MESFLATLAAAKHCIYILLTWACSVLMPKQSQGPGPRKAATEGRVTTSL